MKSRLKILETPRDAMQGLKRFIPTQKKVEMINALLKVGFDIIDVGSFASPKVIPQMSDTAEVLNKIKYQGSVSKLFVLVVNLHGAVKASKFDQVHYIGFPFSPSPAFLKKNLNSDIDKAWKTIDDILNICTKTNKEMIVYLSMAFGNPYGDPNDPELIYSFSDRLYNLGIKTISLSDIIGCATTETIGNIFSHLTSKYSDVEFGIHLHTDQKDNSGKIDMAYRNGCILFEGVINGLGGCPMTGYELMGNIATGEIISWAKSNNVSIRVQDDEYLKALKIVNSILF